MTVVCPVVVAADVQIRVANLVYQAREGDTVDYAIRSRLDSNFLVGGSIFHLELHPQRLFLS